MFCFKTSVFLVCLIGIVIHFGQCSRLKRARHPTGCGTHGTLVGTVCHCHPGYAGAHCEHLDCRNGGTADGLRSCHCTHHYTGSHCEIEILHCQNGGTFDRHSGRCYCVHHYTGRLCEIDTATLLCNSRTCYHGHCYHDNTQYFCACSPGYTGRHCESHWLDCQNGGTFDTRSGRCHCLSQYTGNLCEIDSASFLCVHVNCQHGGHCYHDNNQYYCGCPNGYNGRHCENRIETHTACISKPCLNGGHCYDDDHSYVCICKTEFTGIHCESRMEPAITLDPNYWTLPTSETLSGLTFDPNTNRKKKRGYLECNDIDIMRALSPGRVDHPNARTCPFNSNKQSDAILMKFCGAQNVTSWKKGVEVAVNCKNLPKNIPVAQWHGDKVTTKTGVFVDCESKDRFRFFTQSCDEDYKLTWVQGTETETFYVIGY